MPKRSYYVGAQLRGQGRTLSDLVAAQITGRRQLAGNSLASRPNQGRPNSSKWPAEWQRVVHRGALHAVPGPHPLVDRA
jgi:hypothetical protein